MRAASPTASWFGSTKRKPVQQVSRSFALSVAHRLGLVSAPVSHGLDMNARAAPTSIPKDLGGLLAYATASHARVVAFLLLVCLVAFLPGFFNIPPIDRDEARFAQATKQMIESGDYIDIRYQDEV